MSDPAPPASTMRKDIVSAYLASASRVLAWLLITALVFRRGGAGFFAVLVVARATLGLLNYSAVGLGPAIIALSGRQRDPSREAGTIGLEGQAGPPVLDYATALTDVESDDTDPLRPYFSTALRLLGWLIGIALVALSVYAWKFDAVHALPSHFRRHSFTLFVILMGLGTLARVMSDGFSAVLQLRGRIAFDNYLITACELGWVVIAWSTSQLRGFAVSDHINFVGFGYCASGILLLLLRKREAEQLLWTRSIESKRFVPALVTPLLMTGSTIALAQAADFLYAPMDYLMIDWLLDPTLVAAYAPAVQIDGGLLLMVAGIAAVLFPKTALAARESRHDAVSRYYRWGTLFTAATLTLGAGAVLLVADPLLHVWLGDPMYRTQSVLPLVLISTVVGGSAMVGRSVLLGMGKVKPYTISVLIAGVANVLVSFALVRFTNLGLHGILYGTMIAVIGRCALWQPWYVLRTLRRTARLTVLPTDERSELS